MAGELAPPKEGTFRMRSTIRRSLISVVVAATVALLWLSVSGCEMLLGGDVNDGGAIPVEWVYPEDGATDVPITDNVVVGFLVELDPATVNDNAVQVVCQGALVADNTVVTYDNSVMTVDPRVSLSPGMLYTVTLTTGIHSAVGGYYSTPYTWSFTTAP